MRRLWIIVGSLCIIFGFVCMSLLTVFHHMTDESKIPNDFAVVFDAGSSGTRMYIYNWKAGFSAAKGDPLVVEQFHSCKPNDNGIDKIKSEEEFIQKFEKCIDEANQKIPNDRKNRTYINLAATAGMRLLEAKNATAANTILGYIRNYFNRTNFLFKNSSQVRIITGQEEGTNAWISANYFLKKFKPYADPSDTSGILDLGGASTQIVYVPKVANMNYSTFFSDIKIYGVNYRPYSNSYLCWGVNEINLLYRTYLMRKSSLNKQLNAACYPKSSNFILNTNDIFNSPCANGLIFNYSYNFTVNTSSIIQNDNFTFNGVSDSKICLEEVSVLLPEPKCNYDSCSFDNVYQPTVDGEDFTAFSNFFYTINNTEGILNQKFNNNLDWFKNSTDFICRSTFEELKNLNIKNNAKISDKFLMTLCFSNNYVIGLWTKYGFKNLASTTVTEKVKGYSVGWTLGYLINDLNRDDFLPYEIPPKKLPGKYFNIFIILSTLVTLAFIIFVSYMCLHQRVDRGELMQLKTSNA